MPDLSPSAKASWRRFWRNGSPTPRQTGDQARAHLAAAEELAETPPSPNKFGNAYHRVRTVRLSTGCLLGVRAKIHQKPGDSGES
jgi:hypothetical protein